MMIVGHRGAKNEAPENTFLSFKTALKAGVTGIEVDVHKTADDHLVVIHDSTVNRTTNGKGPVADYQLKDLLKLDAGQGEKIPLLEDVLQFCIKNNTYLFIESKVPFIEDKIAELIKKHNAYEKACVICFYHQFLKNIKKIDNQIKTGCLIECAPIDPVAMVKNADSDFVSISIKTINPDFVSQCKEAGLEICAWNANSLLKFEKMKQLGVDFICTDNPSRIIPSS